MKLKFLNKKILYILLSIIIVIMIGGGFYIYKHHSSQKCYNFKYLNIQFVGDTKKNAQRAKKEMDKNKDIYNNLIIKNNISQGIINSNNTVSFINLVNNFDNSSICVTEDKNNDVKNISITTGKENTKVNLLNSKEICKFLDYKDESTFINTTNDLINKWKGNNDNKPMVGSIIIFTGKSKVYPSHQIMICITSQNDKQYKIDFIRKPLVYDRDVFNEEKEQNKNNIDYKAMRMNIK